MTTIRPFSKQANFTIVNNFVIDHIMPDVSANGFKILMFAIRKTVGWQKEKDRISYSQFMEGCGIKSRHTISRAISELLDTGYILRTEQGASTNLGKPSYAYMLNTDLEIETESSAKNTLGDSAKNALGPSAKNAHTKEKKQHDGDDNIHASEVESLLLNFGISKAIAKRYSDSDIEKVKAWVAWIESNSDKIRNPQGFLVSKLRSGEEAPETKKRKREKIEQICTAEKTELEKLWDNVQGVLKSQLSRQAYLSNFSNAKAIKLETGVLYLRVQENRFSVILERLEHILENTCNVFVEFDKIELVAGGL